MPSACLLWPPTRKRTRVRRVASERRSSVTENGWLEHLFAPLAEARGSRVLRRSLNAVVEALVLGPGHVGHALRHRLGHPESDETVLVGLERNLLVAHLLAEHLRDDLCHVAEGQVFGAQQRNLIDTAPALV